MKKLSYTLIGILLIILYAIGSASDVTDVAKTELIPIISKNTYEMGKEIVLSFENAKKGDYTLFGETSYGSILLTSASDNGVINFYLPKHITETSGQSSYQIEYKGKVVYTGAFTSKAATIKNLETYIGPPSILAGGEDFSMFVVVPTDSFDNPIDESRAIQMKHQFGSKVLVDSVLIKDLVSWQRVYSYEKSGRILLTSQDAAVKSKEFSVEVTADIATSFKIFSNRLHKYADGNQLVTFSTSVIRDNHNNIVTDGTLVTFSCKPSTGLPLKTYGTTIGGIAKAMMLHPDHATSWTIEGYITGIAKSKQLTLSFVKATTDFDVKFENKNRRIVVGPLYSFMEQRIPDGAVVTLHINAVDGVNSSLIGSSNNGLVTFRLTEDFYEAGSYDLTIQALGIKKIFINVLYE